MRQCVIASRSGLARAENISKDAPYLCSHSDISIINISLYKEILICPEFTEENFSYKRVESIQVGTKIQF